MQSHRQTHTHTQTSMRTHCYERVGEKHAHAGNSICTYMYANTYPASSSTLDMQAHTLRASSITLDICTYMYANTYPALLSTLDMQAHTSRASSSTLDMHAGTRIDMGWMKHPELSVHVVRQWQGRLPWIRRLLRRRPRSSSAKPEHGHGYGDISPKPHRFVVRNIPEME